MPFTMTKPTSNTDYSDRTVWPTGTHDFKLVEIQAGIQTPRQGSKYGTDPYPAARFIWEDEEGDRFEMQPQRFPKEFQYNEKSNFLKYVGALYGRKLTAEDELLVEIPNWEEWDDWTSALPHFFKKDNTPVTISSIVVNGEEVVVKGKVVSIVLEETSYEDRDGAERSVNNVVNVLPKSSGGGGKKKSGGKSLDLPE